MQMRHHEVAQSPRAPAVQRAQIVSVVDADHVLIRRHHASIEELLPAEVAVPAYEPARDDWVLIVDDGASHYVTGVLGAARHRRVASAGSVEVLELSATRRLVLSAPEILIEGEALDTAVARATTRAISAEVEIDRLVERTHSSHRFTADLAAHSAGRMRSCVEGSFELHAERASIVSEGDSVVDGSRVLLG